MGCVGVNIAWTPRWFRERGCFLSYAPHPRPPFKGLKCFRGFGVKDCSWAPPMPPAISLFPCTPALTRSPAPSSVLVCSGFGLPGPVPRQWHMAAGQSRQGRVQRGRHLHIR